MSSDQQLQSIVDRMLSALREQLEAEFRAHADRSVQSAVEDVRRQSEIEIAKLRETASQEAEESRKSAEAQIADVRRLLDDVRRSAQQQVEEARKSLDSGLAAARIRADSEIDDVRRSAQQQVDEARKSLDSGVAAARARAESEIEDARRMAQSQVEDVQRATDTRIFELMQELTSSREQAARSARLLEAIRALDDAPSLAEVLERLAQFAGREVDRAALMIVKSDLLYAWRLIGFDLNGQTTDRTDVPVDDVGVLGSAVRERRAVIQPQSDSPTLALPPFALATTPRAAAAFPITVAGDVVAVLYADAPEADDGVTPEWCHRMETLTRLASRVLEALTVEVTMGFRPLLVQPSHAASGRQLSEGAQ